MRLSTSSQFVFSAAPAAGDNSPAASDHQAQHERRHTVFTSIRPTVYVECSLHMIATSLIDIGINLAHDSFNGDREAVIARAVAAGVVQMMVTGSGGESTRQAIEMARTHPGVLFATAGVHPHNAKELTDELLVELRQLAAAPQVVAVGECGLDYFRDLSPRAAQQKAFHRQLELAARVGKPVFLHQRDAHADFVAIVREHRASLVGGVAHCFTGNHDELTACLEMDLYIG